MKAEWLRYSGTPTFLEYYKFDSNPHLWQQLQEETHKKCPFLKTCLKTVSEGYFKSHCFAKEWSLCRYIEYNPMIFEMYPRHWYKLKEVSEHG